MIGCFCLRFVYTAFCSLIRIGVALVEILHCVHTDGISDIDIWLHCRIVAVPSPFHHFMRSYPHGEGIAYECPSSGVRGKQFPFLRKPLVLPGTSEIYLRSIFLIANPRVLCYFNKNYRKYFYYFLWIMEIFPIFALFLNMRK